MAEFGSELAGSLLLLCVASSAIPSFPGQTVAAGLSFLSSSPRVHGAEGALDP